MTYQTLIFALAAVAFWIFSVIREGSIGIGSRFFFAANLVIFFLVGPMLSFAIPGANTLDPFYVAPASSDAAALLVSLGLTSFVIAAYWLYPAFLRQSRLIPKDLWKRMASPERLKLEKSGAFLLALVGIVAFLLIQLIGRVPTFGAVLSPLSNAFDSALSMFCLFAVIRRRFTILWGVAFAWIARTLVFTSASGHAGGMLLHGCFLACYVLLTADVRPGRLAMASIVMVLFFVPYQRWMAGRDALRHAISAETDFSERMSITANIFLEPTSGSEIGNNLVADYEMRGDYSRIMAAAMQYTPAHESFGYGATMLEAATALVPRILWPEKSYLAGKSGTLVISRYTGIDFGPNTCVGLNYLFEFYINFGWIGTIIGMLLSGLLCAWLENWFYKKGQGDVSVEWTVLLINTTIIFSTDSIAMLAMTLPPLLLACWLLKIGFESLHRRQARAVAQRFARSAKRIDALGRSLPIEGGAPSQPATLPD